MQRRAPRPLAERVVDWAGANSAAAWPVRSARSAVPDLAAEGLPAAAPVAEADWAGSGPVTPSVAAPMAPRPQPTPHREPYPGWAAHTNWVRSPALDPS